MVHVTVLHLKVLLMTLDLPLKRNGIVAISGVQTTAPSFVHLNMRTEHSTRNIFYSTERQAQREMHAILKGVTKKIDPMVLKYVLNPHRHP